MAKAKPKRRSLRAPKRSRKVRMVLGGEVAPRRKRGLEGFETFGWSVDSNDNAAPAKVIRVKAAWDAQAKVWYTAETSLPGLQIEANSLFEFYDKLPSAIEVLLEGTGKRKVPFEFIALGHVTIPA